MDAQMRIYQLAEQFHDAINQIKDRLPIQFQSFPHGSCGDTSLLLARYLSVHGFADITYVAGVDGCQSHVWLEWSDYIIDVTAYQFPGVQDRVMVTTDRRFHSQFNEDLLRHVADYRLCDAQTRDELDIVYHRIAERLNTL